MREGERGGETETERQTGQDSNSNANSKTLTLKDIIGFQGSFGPV